MSKILFVLFALSCLLAVSLSFSSFTHDFNTNFRNLVHHAQINHRFRVNHLEANYTKKEQAFMNTFNNKLMGFMMKDKEIMATLMSGQNLTDSQNQKVFQFMFKDKDFPKYIALSMRNDSSNAWLAKMPENLQIKFAKIIIDQMSKSKSMEMTSEGIRSCILKVLNDKQLAKYFVKFNGDFNITTLADEKEFAQFQAKYPALKKINLKKLTDNDKILILKTLIADDAFWNQVYNEKIKPESA